ncbi:MAG: hypothetical protein J7641_00965 [Cyanobacteria bacterium SID2]|nr:hypothetical protein [Cyanobacteria bacterium SID2]
MLLKLATHRGDIEQIIQLRRRVFVDELKIQDPDYQDVFNDYFCKNLMVVQDQRLVGAMRVAFDRNTQRFFASYFVTASLKRNRTTGALLVGGMLRIMEENGIQTLYADSREDILNEYLKFGCEIVGKPYQKYGFSCEWTPIRYQWSQCTSAGQWMKERVRPFLFARDCQWKFPVKLICCQGIKEYETVLEDLIASRQILSTFPVLEMEKLSSLSNETAFIGLESIETQLAGDWLSSQSSSIDGQEKFSFDRINSLIPKRQVLVVKSDSPLRPLAKCYAMLTGKYLQEIDRFSKLCIDEACESIWVWMAGTEMNPETWDILTTQSQKVAFGFQISKTPEDCSLHLLQTYLDFIKPNAQPMVLTQNPISLEWSQDYREFASFGHSHSIVCRREIWMSLRELKLAREFLEESLSLGGSFGNIVKQMNLKFSSSIGPQSFLLIGDPALHFIYQKSLIPVPVSIRIC